MSSLTQLTASESIASCMGAQPRLSWLLTSISVNNENNTNRQVVHSWSILYKPLTNTSSIKYCILNTQWIKTRRYKYYILNMQWIKTRRHKYYILNMQWIKTRRYNYTCSILTKHIKNLSTKKLQWLRDWVGHPASQPSSTPNHKIMYEMVVRARVSRPIIGMTINNSITRCLQKSLQLL